MRLRGRDLWWFAGGSVASFAGGFSWWSSLVLGVGIAAVAVVFAGREHDEEPGWEHEHRRRRDGARGELQDLSWAMVARDGQVGERALRRVRAIGAARLARHGADLDDPQDTARVNALIGTRARLTLLRRSAPLPSVADLRHTLDALDALGPTRAAAPAPATETRSDPAADRRTS